MNQDQIIGLVLGILFMISETMGLVKKGPNGILHMVWKFYSLKVVLEYDDEDLDYRVEQTNLPERETIVMENNAASENVSPNVLLIGK